MAGKQLKATEISSKVRASTLLEVVVSMVLIVVVFTIAMTIYANVLRLSLSVKKLKVGAILSDLALKADSGSSANTISLRHGELRIEQQVSNYQGGDGLQQVKLTAFDDEGVPLDSLKKIRIITENVGQ